jgi:hypothetical protein
MRKQYYFRLAHSCYDTWDVDRLIALSIELPRLRIELSDITELNQPFVLEGSKECPTAQEILEHIRLIEDVDLSYPIILSASGRVMDGMHRVMKAARAGMESIEAVKFKQDPEPDFVGVQPDDLEY